MNKNTLTSLLIITPILIFSLFAKETEAKKPLYLHEQKKTVRSNQEHLNQFISTGNVILEFYTDWCGYCKRMSPLINAVASLMPEFTFININRDFFPDLGNMFTITSVPTLIFLRDGKEIGRYDGGALTEKKLAQLILDMYSK